MRSDRPAEQSSPTLLGRRSFLRAGLLGATAAVGAAACGSDGDDTGADANDATGPAAAPTGSDAGSGSTGASAAGASGSGEEALPAFVPFTGVTPDIEPANEYCVPGFFEFPNPAPEAVPDYQGPGGTVRAAAAAQAGMPVPAGSNSWWKAINKRLGVDLKIELVPPDQYTAKQATLVAGNDLPDMMRLWNPTDLEGLLKAKFADLTPYLSGDNAKQYPCLANIPPETWKNGVFDSKLYAIPMPLLLVSSRLVGRADIMKTLNVSPDVSSADEFLELCQALTDHKKSRWAMSQPSVSGYIAEMFGVPNQWRVDNGKFTRDIETDEYLDALTYIKKMWDAGYFYPDSFAANAKPQQLFEGRRSCLANFGGNGTVTTYSLFLDADADLRMAFMAPPKADGSGPADKFLGAGFYHITALKKASDERIKQLLAILNILAAPFGTQGYLLTHYGAEGSDYTRDSSGAIVTTKLRSSEKIPVNYLPGSPSVYYSAGHPEVVKAACEYEATVTKNVATWPTAGLRSATDLKEGSALLKPITQAVADVVQGRKKLSDWKGVVSTWRKGGGDTIRTEYEKAYAAAHS